LNARKSYTPIAAAINVEAIIRLLEGRWKLVILFHLFGGQVQRFSDLEKLITGISQKMLAQQLRQLEDDGIVERTVHEQVPPKVDYRLTSTGVKGSALPSMHCSSGPSPGVTTRPPKRGSAARRRDKGTS
jgi:DNA-binding HxlR family transcriptional regulator